MDLTFGRDLPDDQYNNLKDLTITIQSVQKDSFGTVYTTKLRKNSVFSEKLMIIWHNYSQSQEYFMARIEPVQPDSVWT